jgi:type I restriction enzyme S subunit
MGEWITDTVINLQSRGILRVEDGNHGESRPRPDEFEDVGVAFIRAADMADGVVLFDSASKINSRARERITKGIGKPGDILISHKGTVGRIARAPFNAPDFVCSPQTTFWRSTNEEILNQDFLYAYMRSPKFAQEFLVRSGETDMAGYVSLTSQRCLVLSIPPIELQRPIGALMSTLDDKIKLNRRTNETLEAMARAIFKDWFVDFGPTRAKMEGRAPYLAPDIWSLFPDRLDNEGKPEGWIAESVYDQAIWVNGAAYKDMHFSSEPDALPVVKIAELKNGITKTTRFTNTDLGKRYKIVDGELLFSWSGNPDTSIDTFVWTSGKAWLNQHIFAVRPNGKRSQAFLYAMLKFLRNEFAEIARNKQTTGLGHVTQQDLIRLRITVPSEGAQAAFDDVVGPLHSHFTSNLFESRFLIATRDFLLPKLMSGEIRVRDAEKAIEAAQ